MENAPKFLRDFSKIGDKTERDSVAEEIRSKRSEYFRDEKKREEQVGENKENISRELENIKKTEQDIERLNESGVGKFLNYFKVRKLKADILNGTKSYEELKESQPIFLEHKKDISEIEKKSVERQSEFLLDDFYKKQKEKWAESEYTKEDISKYFTEEQLSSLSLEDYALLLRRFPNEMVTHVTRQGIRDHVGHAFHTAGEGEYHTGFMNIVDSGSLRSALSIAMTEEEKKEKIERLVINKDHDTKKEALERLDRVTDPDRQYENGIGSYGDRAAVHVAAENVADAFYGAEKGNEIFIAYPSVFIASQYRFRGDLTQGGDNDYNDQWVWANEERGININAGLIFIPADAEVDKKTGSRYEIDENNNPIVNKNYQLLFRKLIDSREFVEFAQKAMEVVDMPPTPEKLQPFRDKLKTDYGIADPRLQDVVLNYQNLHSLQTAKGRRTESSTGSESIDSLIDQDLKDGGILYQETKNRINSKDFWENYFKEHPEKKPTKIVYYKGDDPTKALMDWKSVNRINKKGPKFNLGFSENEVAPGNDLDLLGQIDRFKSIGTQVIEDYFESKMLRENMQLHQVG
jgi:hypothetical protein